MAPPPPLPLPLPLSRARTRTLPFLDSIPSIFSSSFLLSGIFPSGVLVGVENQEWQKGKRRQRDRTWQRPPFPHPPQVSEAGRKGKKVARDRPGRGRVGGSQPAPPGASDSRFCGHQGAPGLLRLAALHQIPLANLIRCLGPDDQIWVPAPLRPQPFHPGNCIRAEGVGLKSSQEVSLNSPKSEGKENQRVFLKRHKLGLQKPQRLQQNGSLGSYLPRPRTAKTEM